MSCTHRVVSNTLREITSRMVVTLSTSGAIPTTEPIYTDADGIISLSSAGSGVYTLTLGRGAPKLVSFRCEIQQASFSTAGACHATLTTNNVAAATPTVVFTTRKGTDFSAVQPATGDILRITVVTKG